jgi:hypothetical protein
MSISIWRSPSRERSPRAGRIYTGAPGPVKRRLPARAGRVVFAGDPTLTAQLNLDILGRKGTRRKIAEQPSAS